MRKTTFPTNNAGYGSDGTPGERLKSAFCHSEDAEYDRDLAQVHDRVRSERPTSRDQRLRSRA